MKEPNVSNISKFRGIEPIWIKEIAPKAFQKIPTVKNLHHICRENELKKIPKLKANILELLDYHNILY